LILITESENSLDPRHFLKLKVIERQIFLDES